MKAHRCWCYLKQYRCYFSPIYLMISHTTKPSSFPPLHLCPCSSLFCSAVFPEKSLLHWLLAVQLLLQLFPSSEKPSGLSDLKPPCAHSLSHNPYFLYLSITIRLVCVVPACLLPIEQKLHEAGASTSPSPVSRIIPGRP